MNDEKIFKEINKYSSMGKLSVFIGAGVSRLSGLPSWNKLIGDMADEIGYKYNRNNKFSSDDLLKIPQIYFDNMEKDKYTEKVKSEFNIECNTNEVHNLIMSLHPNHILTTNYDNLIEKAAIKFGRNFSVLNSNESVGNANTTNYIVKVHGDFSKEFVLKEQDYLDYEENYILIDNIVKTIFSTNLVIFIGYGLNDYNIKTILNWVKRVRSGSFIRPVFINTDDRLDRNEIEYQNKRGLRILDCNEYTNSKKYAKRYIAVLEKIISYEEKGNNKLERKDKLEYLYNKIKDIKNLEYIRREDFNSLFIGEYRVNGNYILENIPASQIQLKNEFSELNIGNSDNEDKRIHTDKNKLDCFEDFLENKDIYKEIDKDKYEQVDKFLKNLYITKVQDDRYIFPNIKINNLSFDSELIKMKKFCSKRYKNLKDNYQKAYYLVKLGDYKSGYILYTKILNKARDKEEWDLYYFSHVNRKYLGDIIINKHWLLDENIYDESFLNKVKHEINNLTLQDIYMELPHKIRKKYPFLEKFYNPDCNTDEYYKILKNKLEVEKMPYKKIFTTDITKYNKIKLSVIESEKFIYDNMILHYNMEKNKGYIVNSIFSWLQGYVTVMANTDNYIITNEINEIYKLNVQDIILMSKSFEFDDIAHFYRLIDKVDIPFNETEELETFLIRKIENYSAICLGDGENKNRLLQIQFNNEIRNVLMLVPKFIKSKECKLKVIEFIIHHYNQNFSKSYKAEIFKKWLEYGDIGNASEIVEEWFISEYNNKIKDNEKDIKLYGHYYDLMEIIELMTCIFRKENYISNDISDMLIENKINTDLERHLYTVLNDEARIEYNKRYAIDNIDELIKRGYNNSIPDCYDEEKLIKDYLVDMENKELLSKEDDLRIENLAAYILMKDMPREFIKEFENISDKYDFLLNIDLFDEEKFDAEWIFRYSDELIKKIKDNKRQREIVLNSIKSAIQTKDMGKDKLKRLFDIYVMLTN